MIQNKRYLIIGPSWIGDMVMSQSLYQLLKLRDPNCQIDVLAPKSTYDLLEFMPEVNQGILAPFKHKKFDFNVRRKIGISLREQNYSDSLILPGSWKSALVPFYAKIKKRIGFKGESRYILLNDIYKLDKIKLPTMIERFCQLAVDENEPMPNNLPWPRLSLPKAYGQSVINKFNLASDQIDKKLIAFCPGAEYGPAKRWPEKYFAQVAYQLIRQGHKVIVLGGPGDKDISDEIFHQLNQLAPNLDKGKHFVDLVAKTSIKEVVAVLSEVDGVLTNDTGLMHIANAFERPTLVIYGSSSAGFTPPLSKKADSIYLDLDCRPCFERTCPLGHMNCLNQLTPDIVLSRFMEKVLNA